jgi:hypothetical protein
MDEERQAPNPRLLRTSSSQAPPDLRTPRYRRVPARVSRAKGEGRWTFTAERVQRRGRSAADCLAEEGEVEFEPGANSAHGVGDDEAAALAVGELAGEV